MYLEAWWLITFASELAAGQILILSECNMGFLKSLFR
jgi:hypothetical protein